MFNSLAVARLKRASSDSSAERGRAQELPLSSEHAATEKRSAISPPQINCLNASFVLLYVL